MKKSLSLILAIAVLLASAFLLGGPTEVRSENPPQAAPTVEPYYVHEDFAGDVNTRFATTDHWVLRLSTRNNDSPRVETEPTPPDDQPDLFDANSSSNHALVRKKTTYYSSPAAPSYIYAKTPAGNARCIPLFSF